MNHFVILPPKENLDNAETRARPGSLRQNPKRRFSTYIPSTPEFVTTNSQPPISLRLKRISDPISDDQMMPPPTKSLKIKKSSVNIAELHLIYLCSHCPTSSKTFDEIHSHWLKIHKKDDDSDPTVKRFCYRVTEKVRCLFCNEHVTYYSIREHMSLSHPKAVYAFVKYSTVNDTNDSSTNNKMRCGICSTKVDSNFNAQNHFRFDHRPSQRHGMKFELMPMLNDSILNVLLQQGDRGTFKCKYCSQYFTCRYDFERHHQQSHGSLTESYDINGSDVIKYGCYMCNDVYTDRNEAIEHIRNHLQQSYQCPYCPTIKANNIETIRKHHQLVHKTRSIEYKMVHTNQNLQSYYQMKVTFSNGLQLLWGEILDTQYGKKEQLINYIRELSELERRAQMKKFSIGSTTIQSIKVPVKIGDRRRQTLL